MFNSVLVVCVGNICRSPVGQRLLAQALPAMKVQSAGLHALVGYPADAMAHTVAASSGIDLSGHRARQLTGELGAEFDLILVMERAHRNEIGMRMPELTGRTMLFGQWLDGAVDIPDPYLQPRAVHEATISLIRRGAETWSHRLQKAQ
jgi:protein-tyrosine phosphatase